MDYNSSTTSKPTIGSPPEQGDERNGALAGDPLCWGWGTLVQTMVWEWQRGNAQRVICFVLWLVPRALFVYCVANKVPDPGTWRSNPDTGRHEMFHPYTYRLLCPYLALAWLIIDGEYGDSRLATRWVFAVATNDVTLSKSHTPNPVINKSPSPGTLRVPWEGRIQFRHKYIRHTFLSLLQ